MDYEKRLSISYYETIGVINESHKVYVVQHKQTRKVYVKKILSIYKREIYDFLHEHLIIGIPHIEELYEENGQLILIEEYISGETLQEKINHHTLIENLVPKYLSDLCDILTSLHTLTPQIIHRDIKPSNIMITSDHRVMLLDFNAAKYPSSEKSNDTILLGTKGYAAPEQYGFGSSTEQTDIYALGMLIKELTYPFPTLQQKYYFVAQKCSQLNPADRYASVSEVSSALHFDTATNTAQTSKNTNLNHTWKRFLPPGFRTNSPFHMLVAIPSYIFVFYISLTMTFVSVSNIDLWIQRIFLLIICICFILIGSNYLNIQSIVPICKSKNIALRFLGTIIFCITTFFSLFIFMMILEALVQL